MARPYDATRAPWLRAVTVLYLCWSLIPLLIAIVFSFNAAPSISRWEGFSLYWWVGRPRDQLSLVYDPELRGALLHSLTLAFWTTVVAVPMGTAFALDARGWRSRTARIGLTGMLIVLVLPRIAIADAMYLVFILPLRNVPFGELGWFGTPGQLAGLITLLMPFATIIVFARLLMPDRHHEDSATDLWAPPSAASCGGSSCRRSPRRSSRRSRARWASSSWWTSWSVRMARGRSHLPCSGHSEARNRSTA